MALYVKIRGKVFGPFDESQLQEMCQRGKLGRANEISADGVNWVRAEENETLFPHKTREQNVASVNSQAAQSIAQPFTQPFAQQVAGPMTPPTQNFSSFPSAPQQQIEPALWYYSLDGKSGSGPFQVPAIISMIQSGVIRADSLLWQEHGTSKNGVSEHSTPEQVSRMSVFVGYLPNRPGQSEKTPVVPISQTSQSEINSSNNVSPELAKPVIDSSVWVFQMLVAMIIGGVCAFVAFLVVVLLSFKTNSTLGMIVFLFGLVPLVGCETFLAVYWKYSNAVRAFSMAQTEANMKRCLTALTLYWKICVILPPLFFLVTVVFLLVVSNLNVGLSSLLQLPTNN